METRANHLWVGGFVLLLLAALLVFVLWLTKVEFQKVKDIYYIFFSGSVTGLQEGSPVRYAGIPVGTVTEIRIAPNDVSQVRVTVELQPGTPVREDSLASLEVQGLTGFAYIQISGGTQDSPPLTHPEDGIPVIHSRPSTLAKVVDAAPQVLSRALDLAERLGQVLSDENRDALAQTLHNLANLTGDLAEISTDLRATMRSLDGLAADARTYAHLLSGDLDSTLDQARKTLGSFEQSAQSLTGDVHELTRSFKKTSDMLGGLVGETREPLRDFAGTGLYDLSASIGALRDLAVSLTRLVNRLERDPAGFLLGSGPRRGQEIR